MAKFTPETAQELQNLVNDESIYLGDIDTRKIRNMSFLFFKSKRTDFSGIETWDVSNVESTFHMFVGCETFNQDISKWDTSKVEHMTYMFYGCTSFNQPLGNWDVSKVRTMNGMFYGCKNFNQDISGWNVSNVEEMGFMFAYCSSFNQSLEKWDVSNVDDTDSMFLDCPIDNLNKPVAWQELFHDKMTLIEVEKILAKLPEELVFQALYKKDKMKLNYEMQLNKKGII